MASFDYTQLIDSIIKRTRRDVIKKQEEIKSEDIQEIREHPREQILLNIYFQTLENIREIVATRRRRSVSFEDSRKDNNHPFMKITQSD